MKLYTKNLKSIDELRQEKKALNEEANSTFEHFFSLDDLFSTGSKKDKTAPKNKAESGNDILADVINIVTSKNFMDVAFAVGLPMLRVAERKLLLKPLLKEVVGGYLKWKATELGFKSVTHLVRHYAKKHKED